MATLQQNKNNNQNVQLVQKSTKPTKKKKKKKKPVKISTVTLTEVRLKEWHLMKKKKKKTGHVTKTEGVADWLICTVHRVTPNCAR